MKVTTVNFSLLKKIDAILLSETAHKIIKEYNLSCDILTIEVSKRLKRAAGNCHIERPRGSKRIDVVTIKLSYDYYKEFGVERSLGTLKHEFAHYIDSDRTGKTGHGFSFKVLCNELGGTMNPQLAGETFAASACTDYLKGTIKDYKWVYTCKCGVTMDYYKRMAERIKTSMTRRCVKCKTSLYWWTEERVAI